MVEGLGISELVFFINLIDARHIRQRVEELDNKIKEHLEALSELKSLKCNQCSGTGSYHETPCFICNGTGYACGIKYM
jgi:hypothetical protein